MQHRSSASSFLMSHLTWRVPDAELHPQPASVATWHRRIILYFTANAGSSRPNSIYIHYTTKAFGSSDHSVQAIGSTTEHAAFAYNTSGHDFMGIGCCSVDTCWRMCLALSEATNRNTFKARSRASRIAEGGRWLLNGRLANTRNANCQQATKALPSTT